MPSAVVLAITEAQGKFLFAVAEGQSELGRWDRAGVSLAQRGFVTAPDSYGGQWKLTKRGKALVVILSDS